MQKMEILAPVGGHAQLLAAVRTGADAVYLGAKGFNARRNAENFEEGSLREAVSYCHARNVKVYVTVNTLITDDELPALLDTLQEIADSGADALIVQDLAVMVLARRHIPGIALHASTQMTIHNAAGAKRLEALGFSRVVLARELTLPEIAQIASETSLALEVFVHGALCMCVSGACYLSSMLGGRSGNRGLCAQPCRLDFRSCGRPYALSLKDLSALGHLQALHDAGVCSLKIEGRMKRPEYVAAAVTACKNAQDDLPYDLTQLEAVFSRGGFTDGYLTGKRDLSMFGTRGHEDVLASQKAQASLPALYRQERQSVPVDMHITLPKDAPAMLEATDGEHTVHVTGDVPLVAHSTPTDEARAHKSLSKLGGTPFYLQSLVLETPGDVMLPAASLNALRRSATEALLAQREQATPKAFAPGTLPAFAPHAPTQAAPALHIHVQSADQLWSGMDAEKVIVPLHAINEDMFITLGSRLVAELPALIFPGQEKKALQTLQGLHQQGLETVLCHNLGAIELALSVPRLHLYGGYGLNILNTLALEAYHEMGLESLTVSFELHGEKIRRLGGNVPRGILAYGALPLMQLRTCPAQGPDGCGPCNGTPALTDRVGARFSLLCHMRQYATLLNSVPLDLSGEPFAGVDFFTLHFTTENADECKAIYNRFVRGEKTQAQRTRGLYYRTLQ